MNIHRHSRAADTGLADQLADEKPLYFRQLQVAYFMHLFARIVSISALLVCGYGAGYFVGFGAGRESRSLDWDSIAKQLDQMEFRLNAQEGDANKR